MRFLLVMIFVLSFVPLQAQETLLPQPVEAIAQDGLVLKGDFYWQSATAPTVLMFHELYSNRTRWQGLDSAFIGAGYNVLAVDLRGYGQTKGKIEWAKAVQDVQSWADWVRQNGNINVDALHMAGSSMGSVLAMVGCGNDASCASVIAISPGWEYFGLGVSDALTGGLVGKRVLIVYAQRDRYPALGVPLMLETAPDLIVETFTGNAHGISLIKRESETLLPRLTAWINGE